jgi:FMN phosphatase YigB (HAD superfamily)
MTTIFIDLIGVAVRAPASLKDLIREVAPHKMDGEIDAALRRFQAGLMKRDEFWETLGIENWERAEADVMRKVKPDPALSEAIGYLKRKNHTIVLVAEVPSAWVEIILHHNRLEHYFDRSYSTADLKATKRQATAYKKLVDEYGDCMLIDNEIDNLRAARSAGMATVLVGKPDGVFKPDFAISSLREIKNIL